MSLAPHTGTLVERYLFSPLYAPSSRWAVLRWWERRRPLYNILVGAAGLVTIATGVVLGLLAPDPALHRGPPLALIAAYGLAANLFYSLGAPLDLLLRRWLKDEAGPVAQAIFRYGLVFSIGLTLLPIPLILLGTILSILNR